MRDTVTGVVLIAVPILFNVSFALLAQRFDYPDVLRRPTDEVLKRFRQRRIQSAADLVGVLTLSGAVRPARGPAGR